MIDIAQEAEKADVIIGGFAIQRCKEGFRVIKGILSWSIEDYEG